MISKALARGDGRSSRGHVPKSVHATHYKNKVIFFLCILSVCNVSEFALTFLFCALGIQRQTILSDYVVRSSLKGY